MFTVIFAIPPRERRYWIEKIDPYGVRTPIENYRTEAEALKCLKHLQQQPPLIEPFCQNRTC